MEIDRIFPLIILVLVEIPNDVKCYKCYQCRTDWNRSCGSRRPVSDFEQYLSECEKGSSDTGKPCCRVITQRMDFTQNKDYSLVRECCLASRNPEGSCFMHQHAALSIVEICECRSEGCNTAEVGKPGSLLLQLLSVICTQLIANRTLSSFVSILVVLLICR